MSDTTLSPVELDEDEVPDLQHVGIVHVHKMAGIAPTDPVVVDLGARPARTCVTHLPEVVLHSERQHTAGGDANFQPQLFGVFIWRQFQFFHATEVGDIEPIFVEAPNFRQELPSPLDGFRLKAEKNARKSRRAKSKKLKSISYLEEITERPISQHLEERVMVNVTTYVIKIIVFPSSANAFLGITSAFPLGHV